MKYDFTSIIDRHGKDSLAVDVPKAFGPHGETLEGFDRIPMWIADMNFPVVPTVQKAIIERVNHPCFGYFEERQEYVDAIINWQKAHNHTTDLKSEHIGYENGVLGGLVTAMNVFCSKGDNVLVHSPTYTGFTRTLENNGYHIIHSPLVLDENNIYRMDFEDMEKKIVEHKIHACVFCSPHNPTGRVFEMEELKKMYDLFEKYQVNVVSDEIWSDLLLNGHTHIPSQSVSEYAKMHTVAMYSLSKTFSLAGMVASYHICYNPYYQDRLCKEASLSHYNSINVLSMYALIGAYQKEGYEWVEELKEVLSKNVNYAYEFITTHFKGVKVSKPQGTYMLYLDCSDWCKAHNMSIEELQKKGILYGILWQDGRPFLKENTIRMNLALPYSRIVEAFDRLDKYVFNAK